MTLLMLAGTGEARGVAAGLAARGIDFTIWQPEGTRMGRAWPAPVHGSALADCLATLRPAAVLDASHPFAVEISHHAAQHAMTNGLPYCLLRRPEWRAQPGDFWTHVTSDADAVRHIPPGSRVLVATGREGLEAYAALDTCHIYCRQIGAPGVPCPLPNGEWLVQEPPFPVEEETLLFKRLGIDWLVLRNAGSARAETKLTAARALGIRAAMIARPAPPDAPCVETEAEALAWACRACAP
ncbi:precorrin-6A/cobalt-precorrin-6A reductase [Roseovarius sp. D0-M9]|uniref:precorrin-6A/cobalt-precorrin-6A reductase n=1 Tax=Roseovarius sp. D0-M9 TaxID=3127117 RepID=UPI00301019AA